MQLTKTLLHTTDVYIKKLAEAGIHTIEDFCLLLPRDFEDKSEVNTCFSHVNIQEKQVVQCTIELLTEEKTRNKKLLTKAVLTDSQGFHSEAVWFNRRMIANQFHTVILSGVPYMPPRMTNEARRFIWLIDVLYDHKIKLIISAEVPAPDLYTEGQITAEFSRTVSRLIEMQSRDYLDAPRRVIDTSLT